jgi:hypothetical protein
MNPVQPSNFGGQMAQMGTQMGNQFADNQLNQSNLGMQQQQQQQLAQPQQLGGMSNQMMGKSAMCAEGEWLSSAPSFSWYSGEKMSVSQTTSMGSAPLQQNTVTEKALFSSPGMATTSFAGPSFSSISTAPLATNTFISSAPIITTPVNIAPMGLVPRGTIHHVHSEKGLRGPIPGATAIGETQPLPPGVIPEHVTEELVTEMPIGLKKKTGRAARRHEDDYHRNLELARADLLKAAEYFKLGNMALHDEWVGKALLHQKEAERNLRLTYRR